MKTKLLWCSIVASALALASSARSETAVVSGGQGGRVDVVFEHPEQYADVQLGTAGETATQVLDTVRDYLRATASPRLAPGTTLTITFTDFDRAGEYLPQKAARQLKSMYPPKAKFSWVLTDNNGKILRQDTENLSDTGYLTRSNLKRDPLFYEKEMLGVWVRRTFR